jgi:L-iditol 2-dehydrogenase
MKQAVMTAPHQIEIRSDVPVPQPGSGEVRLRIQRIGVCGSDIHVYHGKHPYTGYPVVQGHEFSASIDAVGDGVQGLLTGMKVTSMPQIVCGECHPAAPGDYHICDRLKVRVQAPGCSQELWVTGNKIIPPRFTLAMNRAPWSSRFRGSARCPRRRYHRRNVAVFGAGTIGNLVAQTTLPGCTDHDHRYQYYG